MALERVGTRLMSGAQTVGDMAPVIGADLARVDPSGFHRIDGPMGVTGHGGCNTFYLREL